MNIAVIGGHGKVALRATRLLNERGDDVCSFIRSDHQADDVADAGGEPVILNVECSDEDRLVDALSGVDAVVWSAGAGGGDPSRTYAVDLDAAVRTMRAAERADVRRFVMVSYLGARADHGVPRDHPFFAYAEAKAAADAALRASALDWTILMPGELTTDEPSGRINPRAVRGQGSARTSRDNVAQVIAAVLGDPSTIGRDIPFTDGDVPIVDAVHHA